MILKIEETEGGISLIQEDDGGARDYGIVNKFKLIYRVTELLFEWLSTESVETPKSS